MAFGIGDLFSILGGGVWFAKEVVSEICERQEDITRSELIDKFIEENTDIQLEKRYAQEILAPKNHEKLWQRLETYKRENPVWCWQNEKKWRYRYGNYGEYYGWGDVGKKRVAITDAKGGLYGKRKSEREQLQSNRNRIVVLLIETHGKLATGTAELEATKYKYPLQKIKRSW